MQRLLTVFVCVCCHTVLWRVFVTPCENLVHGTNMSAHFIFDFCLPMSLTPRQYSASTTYVFAWTEVYMPLGYLFGRRDVFIWQN